MKIAFFNYLPLEYGGGVAKYLTEVSHGLKKRYINFNPSIVTFDKKMAKKFLYLYAIYFFGKQDRKLSDKENAKHIKQKLGEIAYYKAEGIGNLKTILQKHDRIYTTNNLLELLILKLLIGYRNLPPVVVGFHIPMHYSNIPSIQSKLHNVLYNSFMYQYLLNGVRMLHVLNSSDEKLLKRKINTAPVKKIYNPFDCEQFKKRANEYKYSFNWDKKKANILWVGRLTEQKGVNDLVALIEDINQTPFQSKVVWNIAGEGELKHKVVKVVNKWNNVNYFGYVENDYIASIYKENDLFISTSKWESLPYTLLEAQCFGLFVVSYNINGCNEIIVSNENGYLVSTLDEFKNKIITLVQKRTFKREDVKMFIQKKFDSELMYKDLYKLFKNG